MLGIHYPNCQRRLEQVFRLNEIIQLPPELILPKPKRVRMKIGMLYSSIIHRNILSRASNTSNTSQSDDTVTKPAEGETKYIFINPLFRNSEKRRKFLATSLSSQDSGRSLVSEEPLTEEEYASIQGDSEHIDKDIEDLDKYFELGSM